MKRNLVYVVGLGPGDPQFLTAQAKTALENADVLCGYTVYIDLIRSFYPQKEVHATGMTKEIDRCRWALETAQSGKTVALVCSGDAGVYGMASPILELAPNYPSVEIEVIPGLTAALSGGAVLGAPLAHDFCVVSLSDRLTPWEMIEKRLACAAMGDFCVAIYNPSSKGRPDYLQRAVRILLQNGKSEETVCGIVRNIGRERQQSEIITLRELENKGVSHGMKAVVFSGTTEGRQFSKILANLGVEVLVSVATEIGAEEQDENENITIHVGRCTAAEMTKLLHGASICVDATHPYATEATRTICEACETTGVEYHRLLRTESELPKNSIVFGTAAEAAEYLESTAGNVLLTTGAKELSAFKNLDIKRIFPRVLPTLDGIRACEALDIPHRNIIAMQGPFSLDLNRVILEQFNIQWLVTKDGGAVGGFMEKAKACEYCGARLLVLRRPRENGETVESILERCRELL